jgi:hypothetical protein
MSTWGVFIGLLKGDDYNACNAPIQLPHLNTLQSWGHYDCLVFTIISVPGQLDADMCPLLGGFILGDLW